MIDPPPREAAAGGSASFVVWLRSNPRAQVGQSPRPPQRGSSQFPPLLCRPRGGAGSCHVTCWEMTETGARIATQTTERVTKRNHPEPSAPLRLRCTFAEIEETGVAQRYRNAKRVTKTEGNRRTEPNGTIRSNSFHLMSREMTETGARHRQQTIERGSQKRNPERKVARRVVRFDGVAAACGCANSRNGRATEPEIPKETYKEPTRGTKRNQEEPNTTQLNRTPKEAVNWLRLSGGDSFIDASPIPTPHRGRYLSTE